MYFLAGNVLVKTSEHFNIPKTNPHATQYFVTKVLIYRNNEHCVVCKVFSTMVFIISSVRRYVKCHQFGVCVCVCLIFRTFQHSSDD